MAKGNEVKGPRIPKYILTKLIAEKFHEEFLGDLSEVYDQRLDKRGEFYAVIMYWIDAFHLLFAFSTLKFHRGHSSDSNFKQYTKIAYRNILRNKTYSFTNIISLAIGMGVGLVIFQYVYFELSYDQFHKDHEQLYRVIITHKNGNTYESYPDALGHAFGVEAAQSIPEVEYSIRKQRINRTAVVTNPANNNVFYEESNTLFFVDPSFFQAFNFPLLNGNETAVFSDKYNIVITEKAAKKYFRNTDPIGKQLLLSGPPSPGTYTVTGVMKNIPLNTHLQFDFLIPMANYLEYGWGGAVKRQGGWDGFQVITYFKLKVNVDIQAVENKLNQLIAEHTTESKLKAGLVKKARLQPVGDIYMHSDDLSYPGHFNAIGNMESILIFSFISLIILIIAWVNYINLATAQAMQRAKEVGIRKSLGAQRKQLVLQFIIESFMFNVIASILAIGLAYLLLPILNQVVEKELELHLIQLPIFWPIFLIIVLLGSFISGIYPAFAMSGYKPINMLKRHSTSRETVVLRKGLIVFQFVISLLLLSATYLLVKQTSFMKNQELSVDLNKILILNGPRVVDNREKAIAKFQTFRDELAEHSSVQAVSGSLCVPGQFWSGAKGLLGTPTNEAPISRGFYVTLNFENTYDLEFLAGVPFDETMPDEKTSIINEAALSALGFETPEGAIGQKLTGEDGIGDETIVGVVKNFHWHSLHEGHMPYIINLYENRLTENISIKLNTTALPKMLKHIETTFKEFFPGNPFDYYFADTAFNNEYKAEDQFRKIFICFTILAILIACVGLLALVTHSLQLKIKEIGIRKVLGAGIPGLMVLLSKEYIGLIFFATLVAFPTVWYFGSSWLQNYSYRIALSLDLFVYPLIILMLITLLTISRRTFLASKTNPINSLKAN